MGTSNTVIYCFSGAGNSLRIARDLAGRIGSPSVLPLVDYMNDVPVPNAERVGFHSHPSEDYGAGSPWWLSARACEDSATLEMVLNWRNTGTGSKSGRGDL
jgi:hypothetical protein